MREWREYSYSTAQLCNIQQLFVTNCIIIIIIIIISLLLRLVLHTRGGTFAEGVWYKGTEEDNWA
jgi:hypothetical protein